MKLSELIVVGGGPAGMMAAIRAAEAGCHVTLYEQNEKTGKKLYITGKGRCNLTNACDTEQIFERVSRNASFLYSSIYLFDNHSLMDFFSERGLRLKTERGERVFPASDHSSDVIRVLNQELERLDVEVRLFCKVTKIHTIALEHTVESDETERESGSGKKKAPKKPVRKFTGVSFANTRTGKSGSQKADALILATGGLSYPSTGSDGSAFAMIKELGHSLSDFSPSLVPINLKEDYIKDLQGLSLRNVELTILDGKKKLYSEFGELLFTHFGISGPLVLTASSRISAKKFSKPLDIRIDLKPALSQEKLDQRILKDFKENTNKQFSEVLVSGKLTKF